MANPAIMLYVPFALNGTRNTIQVDRQSGQSEQDATIKGGFPNITMIPQSSGGLAPNGEDFNGIFYLLSADTVHRQSGIQIQYDAEYAKNIGGYAKGSILQSTSLNKSYISTADNNLTDPDSSSSANWSIYAGSGAVKNATSSTYGLVKIIDSLASDATDTALSAKQGKALDTAKLSKTDLVDNLTSDATWTSATANQTRILAEGLKAFSANDVEIVIPNFLGRKYIVKYATVSGGEVTGSVSFKSPFPNKLVFAILGDVIVDGSSGGGTPTVIAWRQDNSTASQLGYTSQNPPGLFSYIAIGY